MTEQGPRRLPTMGDVAERAGVSRQLVSLVLRGAPGPSAASRAAVLRAADELGYRANQAARLLRQDRTRLIGVLFTARNPFEARFVERLLERAPDVGYGVVLAPVTAARTTDVVIGELLERRVEVLACFNPEPDSVELERAISTMPVIWLGERARDPRVDVVRTDEVTGLRLLVQHLVSLGHSRIGYAGGSGGLVGPDRAEAYREAMRGAGLEQWIDVVPVGFEEEDGAAAARQLLDRERPPTAVIACGDACAVGLLAVLARARVAVPGRISVTGYDDSPVAAISYNDLTCVRQDIDLTVDAVLEAVVARTSGDDAAPRDVATRATLVLRGTTGPARD